MKELQAVLMNEAEITKDEIVSRISSQGKTASGATQNSFDVAPTGPLSVGIYGFRYAGVMERGRGRGGIPAGFVHVLDRWARAKGITFTTDSDRSRFLYATARQIAEHGFNPSYYRDIFTTPLENLANRLPLSLADAFVAAVDNRVFTKRP